MNKACNLLIAATCTAVLVIPSHVSSNQLEIASFGNGQLTFSTISNALDYRVEWTSSLTNSWTNFWAAAELLDSIPLTNSGTITVSVPMFYRVVATVPATNGALVINEVDYDQPSQDTGEFVEIFNPEPDHIDLAAFRLEFINGTDSSIYKTVQLNEAGLSIPPDGFLVVGSTSIIEQVTGALTIAIADNSIQNGPDGIRLVRQDSSPVDSFAYEGELTGAGEGVPSVGEVASVSSLSRFPNGIDTDDNSVDFILTTPSPGSANTSP